MGYGRDDSFSFDFEPNGIPFGSENRKENCHHDHIPFNVKGIGNIVFSVYKNSQTGKTSPIRLIAVRQTGVSRHQGGPIEGPLKPPVHHSTTILRGLRNWKYSFISVNKYSYIRDAYLINAVVERNKGWHLQWNNY